MGEFQAMLKYSAVFVTLIACHVSILAHGRQIKPLMNNNVGHKHTPLPALAPPNKYDVARSEDNSVINIPNDVNAFRPTTPGNSPGVGHRKFAGMAAVAIQSPDDNNNNVKVSPSDGFKNDFAPTDPGHSPGVGHPIPHKNGHN